MTISNEKDKLEYMGQICEEGRQGVGLIVNKKYGSAMLANFEKDKLDGEALYYMPGHKLKE
jgi:hypothetical protein